MKYLYTILSVALLLLLGSCIKNDIPYPTIELNIQNIEGEGLTTSGISLLNHTATLTLDEKTDIQHVDITKVTYGIATTNPMMTDTEGFISQIQSSIPLVGEFDLRAPVYVTLSLYQDYEWTIQAEQTIERVFAVSGQIGATEIDIQNLTAKVFVTEETNLRSIQVDSLKLGPAEITTYSPTAAELSGTSFETVRYVDATCHGRTERWRLYVEKTNKKLDVSDYDLWNNTATITALSSQNEYPNSQIQYRLKGTTDWQATEKGNLDESNIFRSTISPLWTSTTNAAGIPVKLLESTQGFFAGKTYEFRLLVNNVETETYEFTTPAGDEIPDGSMTNDELSCFTTKNENSEFWASGNNSITKDLCSQVTYPAVGGALCARLKAFAPPIVGIASGNLMSGTFLMKGTTGTVGFGQPYAWTARPTAMKVKYHATVGIVNKAKFSGAPLVIGDQDESRIFVAIVDWNGRHDVASGTSDPKGIWDPTKISSTDEGQIIAYGSIFIDESTEGDELVEVTLPLNFYDNLAARPTGRYTIVISCSTSAYGDFMTGCTSNIMYVKDFEWVY